MTQEQQVINKLKEDKKVSRNWALQRYITRLGAIICQLNKQGWVIEGKYHRSDFGKNYIYYVIAEPPKSQQTYENN